MQMNVEKTDKELVVSVPLATLPADVEEILNYLRYVQLGTTSVITEADVKHFVELSRGAWWKANRERFNGVPGFERFQ